MLITHRVTLDRPGDFESLAAAFEHYKRATPDHKPEPYVVRCLDDIMARILDCGVTESRSPRRKHPPSD